MISCLESYRGVGVFLEHASKSKSTRNVLGM